MWFEKCCNRVQSFILIIIFSIIIGIIGRIITLVFSSDVF